MANVENLEKKLLKLTNTDKSFAIALTGEWGIGKTRFWNNFYEENHTDLGVNKYSYVSLFGIDSIDALKFEIALSTHDTTQKKDYFTGLKGMFKKGLDVIDLPKLEGTGVTLSLGKGLISSAITSLIGDTLICIDDIERLSKNLDIKDVMGLVNHLSLEKNCKVVVILHEGKADKEFREYKEKVFDEVLVLDDSLSIIKDKISDIDTFPIYEKFYQTMGVRNLRFYQRAQKVYHEIIKHSSSLSQLSKEEILRQILIIKLVNDIPKVLDVDIKELKTYFPENGLDDQLGIFLKSDDEVLKTTIRTKKNDVKEKLSKFYPNFRMVGWTEVVIELIENIDIDSEKFEKILNQDSLNEQFLQDDRNKQKLLTEHHSLNPKQNFDQRFFDNVKKRLDRDDLNNLSFACNTLEQNGSLSLSIQLQEIIKIYIKEKVLEDSKYWNVEQWYFSGVDPYDIFHVELKKLIKKRKVELSLVTDIDIVRQIFKRYFQDRNYDEDLFCAVEGINKDTFKFVIWQPIENERDRTKYIYKLLQYPAFKIEIAELVNGDRVDKITWHYMTDSKYFNVAPFMYQPFIIKNKLTDVIQWTLELLKERVNENPSSKAAIENFLKSTNNLENIQ